MLNEYKEIFRANYHEDEKKFEHAITELKKAGASQIETVRVLVAETGLSLAEADRKVLESPAWQEGREATETFRDAFGDFLEEK